MPSFQRICRKRIPFTKANTAHKKELQKNCFSYNGKITKSLIFTKAWRHRETSVSRILPISLSNFSNWPVFLSHHISEALDAPIPYTYISWFSWLSGLTLDINTLRHLKILNDQESPYPVKFWNRCLQWQNKPERLGLLSVHSGSSNSSYINHNYHWGGCGDSGIS